VSLDDYFDGILALSVFLAGPTGLDRKEGVGEVPGASAGLGVAPLAKLHQGMNH